MAKNTKKLILNLDKQENIIVKEEIEIQYNNKIEEATITLTENDGIELLEMVQQLKKMDKIKKLMETNKDFTDELDDIDFSVVKVFINSIVEFESGITIKDGKTCFKLLLLISQEFLPKIKKLNGKKKIKTN